MRMILSTILHVLLILIYIVLGLFVLTFAIYFFNLDMKLTAAMEPILFHFYDKVKRDQHL